jgi:tripartite ATP-independent transporter DctM subunit
MSNPSQAEPARAERPPDRPPSTFIRVFHGIENAVVVLALALMVLLPLLEIVLRKAWQTGISGSSSFIQHGSLVVGLIGGAIAARQRRLLSLSAAQLLPHGWPAAVAKAFSGITAAVISAMLCVAGVQLVVEEREAGKILAYGIPVWTLQLMMPIGFALITARILWHSAERWPTRLIATALAAAAACACAWSPIPPENLVVPALVLLLLATVLGAPIFAALGGAAVILFWGEESPIASIPVDCYRLVTNPSLPAIPLFTLAGYFLAEGGASQRLIRVFTALFGNFRGGPAVVTVVVCAFFTTFTGASGVTILALGGLLLPILLAARYRERTALGILTSAGSLGMLFPPCLPLILYAIIAEQPIEEIFLAAIAPGMLLVLLTVALGIWLGPKGDTARSEFSAAEAVKAVWQAKWELLLPVVCLVSLFGGFATPVEAAAVTALYACITQTVIHRDLGLIKGVPRVMTECGLVVGGVLLILGVAQGFTNYLVFAQVPDQAVDWVVASVESKYLFLLLLNVFLIVVGCLMDVYSAIVIVVPLIVPIGMAFGVDPLHLGIIFLVNLELGYLTPPVGMNLFLASYRFDKPMTAVWRSIMPFLTVRFAAVLLVTYVPILSTTLPGWLAR